MCQPEFPAGAFDLRKENTSHGWWHHLGREGRSLSGGLMKTLHPGGGAYWGVEKGRGAVPSTERLRVDDVSPFPVTPNAELGTTSTQEEPVINCH